MISLPTCNQSHLKDDLWIGFKLQSDKEIPKIPSFLVQTLRIHMQINWFESIQMGSDRVRITRRWFYSILFHSTYQSRSHLFQTWVKALRRTGLNYSTFPLCHMHPLTHRSTPADTSEGIWGYVHVHVDSRSQGTQTTCTTAAWKPTPISRNKPSPLHHMGHTWNTTHTAN